LLPPLDGVKIPRLDQFDVGDDGDRAEFRRASREFLFVVFPQVVTLMPRASAMSTWAIPPATITETVSRSTLVGSCGGRFAGRAVGDGLRVGIGSSSGRTSQSRFGVERMPETAIGGNGIA
jgi:hypothetical protein